MSGEPSTAVVARTLQARKPRLRFWLKRYLPAEIAGTGCMLLAGLLAAGSTQSAALIAVAAMVGDSIGFYAVLGVAVFREQWARSLPADDNRALNSARRTVLLLGAEFGPASLLDTFVLRPGLMMAGVTVLQDTAVGLLVGTLAANLAFYLFAAIAFTLTVRLGLRTKGVTR